MVYGTSVNKYAEDKLFSMIDDALEVCFKERFWQRHIKKVKLELSDGYPANVDFHKVCREFEDIQTILNNQSYPKELSKANFSIIPDTYTGTMPIYFQYADANPDKVFRCVPPASGVYVWVVFRTLCKPSTYAKWLAGDAILEEAERQFEYFPDDEIPFDALAIKYKTCHNYMVIKGDNPEATQNFAMLYAERINQLTKEETNDTLAYEHGPIQTYQHGWW
jgi:hypothetical protein